MHPTLIFLEIPVALGCVVEDSETLSTLVAPPFLPHAEGTPGGFR